MTATSEALYSLTISRWPHDRESWSEHATKHDFNVGHCLLRKSRKIKEPCLWTLLSIEMDCQAVKVYVPADMLGILPGCRQLYISQ